MVAEQQFDFLAEQAVLASMFSEPAILDDLHDIIIPEDFHDPRNQLLFQTATSLQQEGKEFDPISIAAALKVQGTLKNVGGIGYITEILSPTQLSQYNSDPLGYALIIKDLSLRRRLINVAVSLQDEAAVGSGYTAAEVMSKVSDDIISLAKEDAAGQPTNAADLFDDALAYVEEASQLPEGAVPGIPTGFPLLDEMTGGWLPGQVIAIAARPSVGKTALAMNFAQAAAFMKGKSVLFFSLEMGLNELMMRLISSEGGISLQSLKRGLLSEKERMNLLEVEQRIRKANLYFDASANVDLTHIRSRAVRQKYSPAGLDMIVIDYLGLMSVPQGNRNATRENQVAQVSRGIKLLAKELEIPIIMLAQLNRGPEGRVDKKPVLSDLRESGSIEQDVDVALLIHRPDQSDPNIRPGEADLIIAKNRNGPIGPIPMTPMLEFGKYVPGEGLVPVDLAQYDDPGTPPEEQYFPPPTPADEVPW